MSRKNIYKTVSLYNPETKKSKVVCVKRSDFDTEEALEAHGTK